MGRHFPSVFAIATTQPVRSPRNNRKNPAGPTHPRKTTLGGARGAASKKGPSILNPFPAPIQSQQPPLTHLPARPQPGFTDDGPNKKKKAAPRLASRTPSNKNKNTSKATTATATPRSPNNMQLQKRLWLQKQQAEQQDERDERGRLFAPITEAVNKHYAAARVIFPPPTSLALPCFSSCFPLPRLTTTALHWPPLPPPTPTHHHPNPHHYHHPQHWHDPLDRSLSRVYAVRRAATALRSASFPLPPTTTVPPSPFAHPPVHSAASSPALRAPPPPTPPTIKTGTATATATTTTATAAANGPRPPSAGVVGAGVFAAERAFVAAGGGGVTRPSPPIVAAMATRSTNGGGGGGAGGGGAHGGGVLNPSPLADARGPFRGNGAGVQSDRRANG
ncbi:hypothetical protein DFJ73DRAFT_66630 [Zopfochytrium polystomum]|nr:hypothetical protein DFJ73DRAFT_66630 [Zopfochytrium polystomum]